MFADFIAYAYNAGYEFVTSRILAARIAAQQKATLSETTNGNVVTRDDHTGSSRRPTSAACALECYQRLRPDHSERR